VSLLTRTLWTAARISAAAGAAMLVASSARRGSAWGGINTMTRGLGERGRIPSRYASKRTLLGLAVLTGGLGVMSALYEASLRRAPGRRGALSGSLFALSGYAIDRFVLPRELLRDFERNLGPVGTFAKYAALAVAAAAPAR
jgi:hypothetical protein